MTMCGLLGSLMFPVLLPDSPQALENGRLLRDIASPDTDFVSSLKGALVDLSFFLEIPYPDGERWGINHINTSRIEH
jgi:hypothetical protein